MKLFFIPSKDLFNLFENKKNLEDAADVSFKLPIKGVRHVVLSANERILAVCEATTINFFNFYHLQQKVILLLLIIPYIILNSSIIILILFIIN